MKATKSSSFVVGFFLSATFVFYKIVSDLNELSGAMHGAFLALFISAFFILSHVWVIGTNQRDFVSTYDYLKSQFSDSRGVSVRGIFEVLGMIVGALVSYGILLIINA